MPNHCMTSKEVEGMGDAARLSSTGREDYIFISQHLELGINQSFPSFFDPFRLLTGFARFSRNQERFTMFKCFQIVFEYSYSADASVAGSTVERCCTPQPCTEEVCKGSWRPKLGSGWAQGRRSLLP